MAICLNQPSEALAAYAKAFPEVLPYEVLAERMRGLLLEGGFPALAERIVVDELGVVLVGSGRFVEIPPEPGSACWKAYRLAGGVRPCAECREHGQTCVH